jgi:hypothetical protein
MVLCLSVLYLIVVLLLKIYTRDIIQRAIVYQTEGKVSIDIGKVNIKLSPAGIDLLNTKLLFHDDTGKKVIYDIHFTYLGLQLHSIWDFLFDKKIEVDYLVAEQPTIQVSPELRKKKEQQGNESVHFEIGNIYLALNKITRSMKIKRFGILNGHLTLHKLSPNNTTINIGGVNITGKELAMLPGKPTAAQEFVAGRIRVNTGKQDVTFPEGNYRIQYSALNLDTEAKLITVDGFKLNAKTRDTLYGSLEAGFSRLKIFNMDFWEMYEHNLLKIDSVICQDPVLQLNLDVTPKQNRKTINDDLPLEKRIAGLTGKMKIGYLGFLNCNIDLTTMNNGEFRSFNSKGNNFEAFNVDIDSAKVDPIKVRQVSFAIKNYKSPTKDGLYNIFFDSVVYSLESLKLLNFRMEPSEINTQRDKKYFVIPDFELRELSIADLITHRKLKAKELYLKNSITINNYIPGKTNSNTPPKPLKILLQELNDKIDLENVVVENGFILNQSAVDKNKRLVIGGIRSRISVNDMFDASTYELMGYSIGQVAFDSAVIQNGPVKTSLYNGEARGKEKRLYAKSLRIVNAQTRENINANEILIMNYHFDDEFQNISIDSIRYGSASVTVDENKTVSKKEENNSPTNISLLLNHISAGRTDLVYFSGDSVKASMGLSKIEVEGMRIDPEKKISLRKLEIDGNNISYSSPSISAATGAFTIRESGVSEINDIKLDLLKQSDTIKGSISKLRFTPEINKTLQLKHAVAGDVSIENPVIFASLHSKNKTTAASKELSAEIGSAQIVNGKIDLRQHGNRPLLLRMANLDLDINSISKDLNNHSLSIGHTKISAGVFDVSVNDSIRLSMDRGQFNIELDHLIKGRGNDSAVFDMVMNTLVAKQLNVSLINKKGKSITLDRIDMGGEDLKLDSLEKNHILRRIKGNPSLFVSNINFANVNDKTATRVYGISYRNGGRLVSIDSFRFQPVMDRDSFNRMQTYQKDYMELHTKKISIRNFDIERLGNDSSIHIDHIEISNPVFNDFKDKRLPFESGIIKPLPVDLLKRINVKFDVDSIRIYDGSITYEEFSDKTNSAATVHLGRLQVRLRNIKNYDIGPTDSLYLGATASFLDTAYVGVRFHQSYTDTLSAFLLQIRVGRLSLPALNPVIGPMASAKVISGYLDTLELKAIGREYIAHGKMKMLYKDLKVEFLNKNDQTKKTFVTKVVSFIANILVKRNNLKTTGSVFTERNRERSFINYWIKIVLSGSLTNAGIRSNSRQEKKYRKALKKDHVPDIPDVEL